MAKQKFELTSDLIKVVSEPNTYELSSREPIKVVKPIEEPKEQMNLLISKRLKTEFQIWCIGQDIKMTEGLELALSNLINGKSDS